jgi:hypothetical protein
VNQHQILQTSVECIETTNLLRAWSKRITQLQSTPEPTVTQKIKGPLFRLLLRGLRPFIEIQAKVNPIVKLLFGFHSSVID